MSTDAVNDDLQYGEAICQQRTKENTKAQYKRKMIHFNNWCVKKRPHMVNNGEVLYDSLTADDFKSFFGYICVKREKDKDKNKDTDNDNDNDKDHDKGKDVNAVVKNQSFEHVSGYKSAIVDYYRANSIPFSSETTKFMTSFFAGYKRKIGDLKQKGVMSIIEGKQPITFQGYRYLCQKAISCENVSDFELNIFAHVFLILCWTLIARCHSVGSLMYNHISWNNDSMVIVFPTHKGDQNGETSLPKHVYANPLEPSLCPILSFAIYIFCYGFHRKGSKTQVFDGDSLSESRFSKWLKSFGVENEADFVSMGLAIVMIGTHSFRKGVASYLSSMCGGPSAVAIYLRAGWSLGPVQSRYILEAEGSDQVCGRAATGLPLTDPSFATLPPHFHDVVLTLAEWEEILPGYTTFYPESFRQVIPYLLASLTYHKNYLENCLPKNHPLFYQRVWTSGIMNRLSSQVYAGVGRNPITKLVATGIPPHILLANRVVELESRLEMYKETIMSKIDSVPKEVKAVLLENFRIDGTVPLTAAEVDGMISGLKDDLLQAIRLERTEVLAAVGFGQKETNTLLATDANRIYSQFTWGERIHPIPESFQFPRQCNVRSLWDMWWFPNDKDNIAPFRHFKAFDMFNNSDKQFLSKSRQVIKAILSKQSKPVSEIRKLDINTSREIFEECFVLLCKDLYSKDDDEIDKHNIGRVTYITVYDLILNHKKKNQEEEE